MATFLYKNLHTQQIINAWLNNNVALELKINRLECGIIEISSILIIVLVICEWVKENKMKIKFKIIMRKIIHESYVYYNYIHILYIIYKVHPKSLMLWFRSFDLWEKFMYINIYLKILWNNGKYIKWILGILKN